MCPPTTARLGERLAALSRGAAARDIDAVLVTPGANLAYLLGHSVASHERLTVLLVPRIGAPQLLVPALEAGGWPVAAVEALGVTVHTWPDGVDPHGETMRLLRDAAPQWRTIAVGGHMPAAHVLPIADLLPGVHVVLATELLAAQRMRKDSAEQESLRAIGAAIDRVHRRIGEWLRPGRTEREVAADIAEAVVAEGHVRADFVIVAAGPNGASPHHEASDRPIRAGELVVVDIGGPGPDGYCSDSTRTYATGGAPLSDVATTIYDVVRRAQQAAVAAVRPGVSAESIDAVARNVIAAAGYAEHFITRTGHGIGLEVHEEPYIVTGNELVLEPGMAFSIEPGIYLPGECGVRIEDIVIVADDGVITCNNSPTELTVVGTGTEADGA